MRGIVMKILEERAKKYSLKDFDGYYTGREKAMEEGYIAGAAEQKDIDIDKACEIVRNIANKYFGDWEQSCKVEDTFRKAMGE